MTLEGSIIILSGIISFNYLNKTFPLPPVNCETWVGDISQGASRR